MNTRLLSIIQSEQERRNSNLKNAVQSNLSRATDFDKSSSNKMRFILKGLRTAFHVLSYYDSLKEKRISLFRRDHKYVEVEEELTAAGIDPGMITKIEDHTPAFSSRILAFLTVIRSFTSGYRFFKGVHTFQYFEVLFLYTVLCKWLRARAPFSACIIIGDLSPDLISLSAACKHSGHTLVYWQYSFLDFKHLPVEADIAIILNNTGVKLSKLNTDKPHYWRNIGEIKDVKTENINQGPVGIVLNVLAREKAWDTIIDIQKEIGLPCIVRFHPNSKLAVPELPEAITISDRSEPLELFAEKISLAVCGNTQAQAKLLMLGVPVVQLEGLDILHFDFHGYIQREIVYGIQKPEYFEMSELIEFYHSDRYKTGLFNLIGPTGKDRQPGLETFVDSLTNSRFL